MSITYSDLHSEEVMKLQQHEGDIDDMNTTTNPVSAKQAELDLEQEALSQGISRYNSNLQIRGPINTKPGHRVMMAAVEPLAAAIKEKIAEATGKRQGRRASILPKLARVAPEALALIATRAVMQAITERKVKNATARLIGSLVSEHDDWTRLMSTDKGLAMKVERQLKKVVTESHRRRVATHVVNKYTEGTGWTDKEQMMAGSWLLEMLVTHTKLAEVVSSYSSRKRRKTFYVQATEHTEELLRDGNRRCEILDPTYMPMVIPPQPWTGMWNGGYLQRRMCMVKTRNKEYVNGLRDVDMPQVYDALNALQEVPYRINKAILAVLGDAWKNNDRLPDIPNREPEPLPAKPHDIADNAEARKAWSRQAAVVYAANINVRGKRICVASKVSLAEKLKDYPKLYFPHTMDWRGRVYPVPIFLQPQGDDMAKALLQFAEGKPLGEEGVLWLKIHVANLFGIDKVSFGERIQWVDDNLVHLLASGVNPKLHDYWQTADKPWQALAACFELVGWSMMGEDYVSHLPIAMDGSCNGLQNLSAMLRDEVGGAATNLIPSDKPADIYTQVAERVMEKLRTMDDPIARKWLELGVPRKLVKRPVMTRPYGVTAFGMRDQMMAEVRSSGILDSDDEIWPMTSFLSPIVSDAINEIVVASKDVMDWLQECAKVCADANLPLTWTTPVGFPVLQDYRKLKGEMCKAYIGGVQAQFRLNTETKDLDRKKQGMGMSPNVIHSFDAAHMMLTVNGCVNAGIGSLSMVHDSYATHACDVGEMNSILRQAFIGMYQGDVLRELYDQFVSQAGDSVDLPEPPATGKLDLSLVEESLYFFA